MLLFDISEKKVYNSNILRAKNDNMVVYYIISDSKKNTNGIFDSIDIDDFTGCFSEGQNAISGNLKSVRCKNPNYLRIASKIKNTMIYIETVVENESNANAIINMIGYGVYN